MRRHLLSIAVGLLMIGVGAVLRFAMADVDLVLVTPSALGLVLIVLGAIEVVVSGAALATPSTRHLDDRDR